MKTISLKLITKVLTAAAELSPKLLPLLQVTAVIIGLVVIGLMVWKGKA